MADEALIQSIQFTNGGGVDITYAEERNITDDAMLLQMLQIAPGVLDLDDLMEACREVLDAGLKKLRPAPERIVRTK